MQYYAYSIATERETEDFEVFALGGVVGPEKNLLAQFGWKRKDCCWRLCFVVGLRRHLGFELLTMSS
jgi:hypothetical protein